MTQWYVKDLSKLTNVSVQTLHHYDRIGLLKPSVRQENGYRLYSEKDLLKLQQIIALKFFGFELAQIKTILAAEVDVIDHFVLQSELLDEKAKAILQASKTLKKIVSDCNRHKSIPWKTIIKLIEDYRMSQQIEENWVTKVLNSEELKDYANFEQGLKTRFTANEKETYEKAWAEIVGDINANSDKDPASEMGRDIGKRCMTWVNDVYGKKHVMLRKAIWEKGFMQGHAADEYGLSSTSVAWLDKAIYAYYFNRAYSILNKVGGSQHDEMLKLWEALLVDMCGNEQSLQDETVATFLKDDNVSQAAKTWLRQWLKK